MNREEILELFSKRAEEMISKWPESDNNLKIPQHQNTDTLIEIVRNLHQRKKITSVLDLGCGLGRWARFWTEGIGVGRYSGIEPVARLADEAERRHEPRNNIEIIQGELTGLDAELGKRSWDLGFTFTVIEHMPPDLARETAAILRRRTNRLMLIEMIRESSEAKFCEHVFKHDYEALFGPPSYIRMIDENKALMIWE